jgi:hypothetical protein
MAGPEMPSATAAVAVDVSVDVGAGVVGACVLGVVGAGVLGAGVVGAGVVGAGVVGAGVVGAGVLGAGVLGAGVVGAGVLSAGVVGAGVVATGVVGAGVLGADVVGAGVVGADVVGAGVAEALAADALASCRGSQDSLTPVVAAAALPLMAATTPPEAMAIRALPVIKVAARRRPRAILIPNLYRQISLLHQSLTLAPFNISRQIWRRTLPLGRGTS